MMHSRRLAHLAAIIVGLTVIALLRGEGLAQDSARIEEDLVPAVVQIAARVQRLDAAGQVIDEWPVPLGSGSFVSPDGLVITSNHVLDVTDLRASLNFDERVVEDARNQYLLRCFERDEVRDCYRAGVVTADATLDLAVLRVTGGQHGQPADLGRTPTPYMNLGDSGTIRVGHHIHVIGYPGWTTSFSHTEGSITGREFKPGIDGYAWFLSDAEISGGSSGGAALNADLRLIGVTTSATELVCRELEDGSGCKPYGDSVARLRPINHARELLNEADPERFSLQPPSPVTTSTSTSTPEELTPTATVTPEATATGGSVVLREDFTAIGSWVPIAGTNDRGAYFADIRDGEWAMWSDDDFAAASVRSPVPGDHLYADAAIEVEARVINGGEGVYVAVACRYQDNGDRYQLSLDPAQGTYRIHRSEGGTSTDLVPWTASDAIRRVEARNRLRLDCTGDTVSATINGVPVTTVTDDRLAEGRLGLIAGRFGEQTGPFEARFDNLEVTTAQARDANPGTGVAGASPPQLYDDFADGEPDPARWELQADRDGVIEERDGALHLAVTPPAQAGESAQLVSFSEVPVRELAFTITMLQPSYEATAAAGAGIDVLLDDGQLISVKMGPGTEGVGTEVSFCPDEASEYTECDNQSGPPPSVDIPVPVRIVWTGTEVEVFVGDAPALSHPATSPITEWQFSLYAEPGSMLHAAIDEVTVVTD